MEVIMKHLRYAADVRLTKGYNDITPPEEDFVLSLGDSFTYGAGVEDSETFSAVLQQDDHLGLPVVNAGVGGAGVKDMHDALMNFEGAAARIKLISLTILDVDFLRAWEEDFVQYPDDRHAYSWDDEADFTNKQKSLDYNFEYAEKILAFAADKKIPVVVTLWPRNIFRAPWHELVTRLDKICQTAGVPLIKDLQSYLDIYHNEKLIVSATNWHPSPLGHRIAAKRIHDEIKTAGLLPEKEKTGASS